MTVYCGVDFHARKQTLCYLTTEDGELKQLELPHEHPEQPLSDWVTCLARWRS